MPSTTRLPPRDLARPVAASRTSPPTRDGNSAVILSFFNGTSEPLLRDLFSTGQIDEAHALRRQSRSAVDEDGGFMFGEKDIGTPLYFCSCSVLSRGWMRH